MLTEILPHLYIGDWQDAERQYSMINTMVVVTVAKDSPFSGDFQYDLVDEQCEENKAELLDAISTVEHFVSKGDKVLVHCVSGISRSAAVVIGYLLRQGKTYDEAYELVRKKRPSINPDPALVDLLKEDLKTIRQP